MRSTPWRPDHCVHGPGRGHALDPPGDDGDRDYDGGDHGSDARARRERRGAQIERVAYELSRRYVQTHGGDDGGHRGDHGDVHAHGHRSEDRGDRGDGAQHDCAVLPGRRDTEREC